MHKVQEIAESIVSSLQALSGYTIERMRPDLVTENRTIRVIIGDESNSPATFEEDQRELTIYTDIYLQSLSNTIENDALAARELVENILIPNPFRSIGVIWARLISQDEITYNEKEADQYAVMLRLTWQFVYLSDTSY